MSDERDDLGPLPHIVELFPEMTEAEAATMVKVREAIYRAKDWVDLIDSDRRNRPAPGVVEKLKKVANTFLAEMYPEGPELQIR